MVSRTSITWQSHNQIFGTRIHTDFYVSICVYPCNPVGSPLSVVARVMIAVASPLAGDAGVGGKPRRYNLHLRLESGG